MTIPHGWQQIRGAAARVGRGKPQREPQIRGRWLIDRLDETMMSYARLA
jgi:hypothetical protein